MPNPTNWESADAASKWVQVNDCLTPDCDGICTTRYQKKGAWFKLDGRQTRLNPEKCYGCGKITYAVERR